MRTNEFDDWTSALAAMEMHALRSWSTEYYPREGIESALANRIRRTTFLVDRLPGGVWLVTITVRPLAAWQTEKYFWRMNLIGGVYYLA
jgi:hypothetical protein